MTQRWIVTALGQDRPGIVAGVTKVLYQLGCNLEDSAMTRLEGEFAVMLIFSTPGKLAPETLRKAFVPLERTLHLAVHLKALSARETHAPRKTGKTHLISVYGADRPGIVFKVSDALSKAGINITDLHTHRSIGGGPSLYMMLLEVEVPASRTPASLEAHLKQLAKRLKVQVSLRQSDASIL